jgi:hypothetical protein
MTTTSSQNEVVPAKQTKRSIAVLKPQPRPLTIEQQIIHAASDPRINIAKMKELADFRRQMRMEDAEEQFNLAMGECQAEMRPIEANASNPQTKSKYATLDAVDRALRPIYSKHGFTLSFNTTDCPIPDHIRVLCYVTRGLHKVTYQHDVAITTVGPKGNDVMTKIHAGGSALSYGKRYLELMIFHITISDGAGSADDDGNKAGGTRVIDGLQLGELRKLMSLARADEEKFLELFQIGALTELPASHFSVAKQQLSLKIKSNAAAEAKKGGDKPGML